MEDKPPDAAHVNDAIVRVPSQVFQTGK